MSRREIGVLALLVGVSSQPSFGGCQIFPSNMAWNVRIDSLPVHPSSAAYISTLGTNHLHMDFGSSTDPAGGCYYGIPWNQVSGSDAWQPFTFDPAGSYYDESDCATGNAPPYVLHSPCDTGAGAAFTNVKLPIPTNALVEGGIQTCDDGNDHHLLLADTTNCVLWEIYQTYKDTQHGGWYTPGGVSRWDMNTGNLRPKGWTSADAAGLPIMPLLLKASEATGAGSIKHAIRFTLQKTQIQGPNTVYEWPASHNTGGGGTSAPKMGQRFRLKSSFVIPTTWDPQSQAIATAFKQYGLILADIGSSMFVQGEPNAGWNMDNIVAQVQTIAPSDFEAVDISSWKSAAGFNASTGIVPGAPAPSPTTAAPHTSVPTTRTPTTRTPTTRTPTTRTPTTRTPTTRTPTTRTPTTKAPTYAPNSGPHTSAPTVKSAVFLGLDSDSTGPNPSGASALHLLPAVVVTVATIVIQT